MYQTNYTDKTIVNTNRNITKEPNSIFYQHLNKSNRVQIKIVSDLYLVLTQKVLTEIKGNQSTLNSAFGLTLRKKREPRGQKRPKDFCHL